MIAISLLFAFVGCYFAVRGGPFYAGRLGGPPRGNPISESFGRMWFGCFGLASLYFFFTHIKHR